MEWRSARPCAARVRIADFKRTTHIVYLRFSSCPCTEYVRYKTNANENSNRYAMTNARLFGAKWFHALHTVRLY